MIQTEDSLCGQRIWRKRCSQGLKVLQVSKSVGNGAREIVVGQVQKNKLRQVAELHRNFSGYVVVSNHPIITHKRIHVSDHKKRLNHTNIWIHIHEYVLLIPFISNCTKSQTQNEGQSIISKWVIRFSITFRLKY